ncbi:MAG TPA: hypothetical protein DGG95_04915 [Cytophagales bacterium]|jgi:hypothetical protein|nr:hypothetical protein [Cytophagales bacterium]
MKIALKLAVVCFSVALASCSKSADPSATSNTSLTMSASTASGKAIIYARSASINGRVSVDSTSGITFTDVKVNVRDIKFDFDKEDKHFREEEFKKDSAYSSDNDPKLKGPFIVDLMNAGSFVDQVVTTLNLPNATYERVRFKLVPDSASGDMLGKSILVTGKIDTIPFVFWHKRDANFGAHFYDSSTATDSTSVNTTGSTLNLAIHFELDKIFSALNGGVDLTKAVDGNKDGVITIDPNNTDGNKWIADQIMMLLVRHARCERHDH